MRNGERVNPIGGAVVSNRQDVPAPQQGLILTHFLTVRDVARSRDFYADILGGHVVLEQNPAIVKVANSWIIMNPGGGPTPDKPDVTLAPPNAGDPISSFLNVRVADIASFYADAKSKGAQFLTEPLDRKAEIRCYLRDPDGYLIEVGEATGMLEGVFADPPAGSGSTKPEQTSG
jgi:catechol 2,3-dioxygenase-like lactoylglutathione lyase family enzyme